MLNVQPNKHLNIFQKLVVQNIFVKQLNKWLDELEWENEKKETIIKMKDQEIGELQNKITSITHELNKVNHEFRVFVKRSKDFKKDEEKTKKQQELIDNLKEEVRSLTNRLETRDRMMKLLEKQK